MRKAGNVVLIIGGVLALIGIIFTILVGVMFINIGNPDYANQVREAIQQAYPSYTAEQVNQVMTQLTSMSAGMGIFMIVLAVFELIGAVLAFITAKIQNKVMYVLCLVLGILTGNLFFLIGGILGLIKD